MIEALHTAHSSKPNAMRRILLDFKSGKPYAYHTFKEELKAYLENVDGEILLVPIPPHLRGRTNVISKLAAELAQELPNVRHVPNLLTRRKNAPSFCLGAARKPQTIWSTLSITQPRQLSRENVLLLDDATTTGMTLNTVALMMQDHDPRSIEALALVKLTGNTFIK